MMTRLPRSSQVRLLASLETSISSHKESTNGNRAVVKTLARFNALSDTVYSLLQELPSCSILL